MGNTPIVSICIPTYNGERTIESCIRSVLRQTFHEIEIVVSDDQSLDNTLRIVDSILDQRIRILPPELRSSVSANWNRAVRECRGEFIKMMGQDDLLFPECIAEEMRAIQSSPSHPYSFSFSRRNVINEKDQIIIRDYGMDTKSQTLSAEQIVKRVIRSGTNPIGEPVVGLVRREAILQTSGYTGSYTIDIRMWMELLSIAPAIFTHKTLMSFRVGKGSWSYLLRSLQAKDVIVFHLELKDTYPDLVTGRDLVMGRVSANLKQFVRIKVIRFLSVKANLFLVLRRKLQFHCK